MPATKAGTPKAYHTGAVHNPHSAGAPAESPGLAGVRAEFAGEFPADADGADAPRGIGLNGTSGHSFVRRLRFASGYYTPFAAAFILFFAKDMYILKFGADAVRCGAVATAWALFSPLVYLSAGRLMDAHLWLSQWPGWGRRAPWFATHVPPLSATIGLIFMPGLWSVPEPGSPMLDVWFAICLVTGIWYVAVLLNTLDSARVEIYPFKGERVQVEALSKFVGVFAVATAISPQLLLWALFTFPVRAAVSGIWATCLLLSLAALPTLQDAQQPCAARGANELSEFVKIFRSPPMMHASLLRFWHSACDTTANTFSIYYLTFVGGLTSRERAFWMALCGFMFVAMELGILVPFWNWLWSGTSGNKSTFRGHSMQKVCLLLYLQAAVVPPLLMLLLPRLGVPSPWEWVACVMADRLFLSPQSFFRTISFSWAVDDDCHRGQGSRREALHAGLVRLFEEEGRTIAMGLTLGLGWMGLQVRNCDLECQIHDQADCMTSCELQDIAQQPATVANYIMTVRLCAIPVFALLAAFHIWRYPIHGRRLEALQVTQSVQFKDVRAKQPPASLATGDTETASEDA